MRALGWIPQSCRITLLYLPFRLGWNDGWFSWCNLSRHCSRWWSGKTISIWCAATYCSVGVGAGMRPIVWTGWIYGSFDASGFNTDYSWSRSKLDTRNGDRASEFPYFVAWVAGWNMIFMLQWTTFRKKSRLVENAASIGRYAASDPAECLPCLSEYLL